jgi:hypothetical protein
MTSNKTCTLFRRRLGGVRLSFFLLLVGALFSILWSIIFSVITITIPYQIELREGAAQVVTRLLLSGENPYTFEHQPLAVNIYGLGYNLSALPFAALFGNTLIVHRSITLAFIVLSAIMVFAVVYKGRKDISLALTAAAFVMIGLIGNAGIGAFSSATGAFFLLASVMVPFLRSYNKSSLALSAILALFAFYTKPYFVVAVGLVASFLFLFVSKKAGVLYTLFFLFLFAVAFGLVRSLFPLYFFNSLIINMSMSQLGWAHMWLQLSNLFLIFLPILALSIFVLVAERIKTKNEQRQVYKKTDFFFKWEEPFFNYVLDYCLYLFLFVLLTFVLILGRHMGNYMNYAYQLIVPTFFCWFFSRINLDKKISFIASLLVVFNLFSWQSVLLNPHILEQKNSKEWARLFSYVHSSTNILNSQVEASEVIRLGLTPIDTGQTIVYYQVKPFPKNPFIGINYEDIVADGVKYTNSIDQSIQKQRFDTVISVEEKGVFYHIKRLGEYYSPVDEIQVEMPQASQKWTVVIWKPK